MFEINLKAQVMTVGVLEKRITTFRVLLYAGTMHHVAEHQSVATTLVLKYSTSTFINYCLGNVTIQGKVHGLNCTCKPVPTGTLNLQESPPWLQIEDSW